MERREFLTVTGGVVIGATVRTTGGRALGRSQAPTLGPAVFAQRIERLQAELKTRKLDLFAAEPSTNFQYLTGYNPGRSERLILLMVPVTGKAALICPSFEVERIKRNSAIDDVRGWEESHDPWGLVKTAGSCDSSQPRTSSIAQLRLMR